MNIYSTKLYKALERTYPDLWQIKDYLGKDTISSVVSPYLDENGDLDPNPLWAMLNPDITPDENLEKNKADMQQVKNRKTPCVSPDAATIKGRKARKAKAKSDVLSFPLNLRFKRPCFLPFPHIQFPHSSTFPAILVRNKGI